MARNGHSSHGIHTVWRLAERTERMTDSEADLAEELKSRVNEVNM